MRYSVVISKRVKNIRVCVVLKRPEGNENLVTKLMERIFAGKKQAQSSPGMQKVG